MNTSMTVQLTNKLATNLGMDGGEELVNVLKATAFKGQVSDAQMTALLIVSSQYGLNPWTKEIYAFPDKNNGIVPVVGVDGWARIINNHPQFDGVEFEQNDDSCTCIIFRKDRGHPIKVTEYMSECKRANAGPWASHPRRMLRHKSLIQCARLAFGYGGIYDQDEAERIVEEKDITAESRVVSHEPAAPTFYSQADFERNFPAWCKSIQAGKRTPDDIIAIVSSKAQLTAEQVEKIKDCAPIDVGMTFAEVAEGMNTAGDIETLDLKASLIGMVENEDQQAELTGMYRNLRAGLEG